MNKKKIQKKADLDIDSAAASSTKEDSKPDSRNRVNKKFKDFKDRKRDDKSCKFGKNDVTWYLRYPELARDVANIAQNYIPGISRCTEFGRAISSRSALAAPAGLRLGLIITPGMADTSADGFNMSMKSLWLQMHRKYRGIGTYQSADLGAVIFSILAVFAFIAEGERAYGVCAHYEARNRTIPTSYEALLNWDFSGLRADLANFRYQLNRIIKKASILCLPKGLPAFEDVIQMFSNLFKDRDTVRAQTFAAYQKATWEYDPTSINSGSAVKGTLVAAPWNSSSYLLRLEHMVDVLVLDDDVARICSDIIACFESDIQTLLPLPEDYTVTPVYHEVRSLQLHNLRSVKSGLMLNYSVTYRPAYTTGTTGLTGGDGLWVYQENNIIKFRTYVLPVAASGVKYYTSGNNNTPYGELGMTEFAAGNLLPEVYDIWKDTATSEDILEMTRLSSAGVIVQLPAQVGTGNGAWTVRVNHGLYIVDDVYTIMMTTNLSNGMVYYTDQFYSQYYANDSSINNSMLVSFGIDNAPLIFGADIDQALPQTNNFGILGGVDNLLFIKDSDLEQIHDVCVLSEYQFSNTLIK